MNNIKSKLILFITTLFAMYLITKPFTIGKNIYAESIEENSYRYITSELSTASVDSLNVFTSASQNLNNRISEYTENIIIELSEDELNYYSSLDYENRLAFLFDTNFSLADRIDIFLGEDKNNFGLIYYDLSSNEEININGDLEFSAASTYKLGLNVLFYYLASQGEINLNEYISYTSSDYEEGTGILYTTGSLGSYTIQDLLDYSIIYSDNIATNMLGRYLGGHSNVRQQLYELLDIDFNSKGNYITANIELSILKYLYSNRNEINFSHLIETLKNTEFHDRLDKYIPEKIVAHKIGTYDSYVHDTGIIFDDNPYILIIYTHAVADAEEKIAQISKAIYEN